MIESINHLSFTVKDVEKSADFYEKILGLELVNISERDSEFSERATGIKGAHLKIAYLKASNCSLELIQYLYPQGKKLDSRLCDLGSSHICFNVRDFSGLIKKLEENKIDFINKPQQIPAGPNKGKRMFYAKDPEGNFLEFIEVGY